MITPTPNSWGSLVEFNPCHNPAGPGGGQFCSDTNGASPHGYTDGKSKDVADVLRFLHTELRDISFKGAKDQWHEVMVAVGARDAYVHDLIPGTYDEVQISRESQLQWNERPGAVITVHTHPSSGTFSLEDFVFHAKFNQRAALPMSPDIAAIAPWHQPKVSHMIVFGRDGSWYEMTFPRVFTDDEIIEIQSQFHKARDVASQRAGRLTDAWAHEQPWMGGQRLTDRAAIGDEAEKHGQREALYAFYERQWRDSSADVWTGIAARFGLGYRYHQTP